MTAHAVVTGTPQPLDPLPRLPLPRADDVAAFLRAHRPAAVLWAAPPLDPVVLDAALARPVAVLPFPDPLEALPAGPIWRRAAGDALARCTVLAERGDDARLLRRLSRAQPRVAVTGPLQDGGAVPLHDEGRRAAIAGGLAGRPVWFSIAPPPARRAAVLAAHDAVVRRVHRALLVIEDPSAGPGAVPPAPRAQDSVLHVAGPAERGLWHRVAPVTLMADTFDPGARADPLAPAALGSAILHGPATGDREGSYARLGRVGAARRLPGAEAIAAGVEDLLLPEAAARQAGAAWAEVTRGAEGTDRAAAAVIEALERAGAL